MSKRLTTRGYATAQAIANREEFTTSGSLSGVSTPSGAGYLNTEESNTFWALRKDIDYVVYSYATPIAYHVTGINSDGWWHIVNQKFSVTTSKHQGNLYLL